MHTNGRGRGVADDLPTYIDLLSHDLINTNQAVLSYIDLMMAGPGLDDRSRGHALRAISQVRISTQIFESIKILCLMRKEEIGPTDLEPMGLDPALRRAADDLRTMFPGKKVELDVRTDDVSVAGGKVAYNAVLNMLMNIAQLAQSHEVVIGLRVRPTEEEGLWAIDASSTQSSVPPGLPLNAVSDMPTDSRSRMVRMGGFLLAKVMAEALGGSFDAKDEEEGSTFTIALPGAVGT